MKKKVSFFGAVFLAVSALAFVAFFAACDNGTTSTKNYYLITFDKNGGTSDISPKTMKVDEATGWQVGQLPAGPTRVGDDASPFYIFDGWNSEPDGSGVSISEGDYYYSYSIDGDITAYAQWVAGSVSVKESTQPSQGFTDLKTALDSISGAGSYTVKIGYNPSLAPYTFSGSGMPSDMNVTLEAVAGDITITCSAPQGDLFTVVNSTLTLSSGIILNGGGPNAGRGVHVGSNGIFIMEDGQIIGCTGSNSTGVYVDATGTFTMTGGTISGNGNTATPNRGGVYNLGTFNISGKAIISGNTGAYGGGVYNQNTFTMEGGTISGNTAASGGGGVYNSAGTVTNPVAFTMSGGTISDNKAGTDGGGVLNYDTFTMSEGATISGNTAHGNGGGVSIGSGSSTGAQTFNMINGTISENKAETGDGGGVFVVVSGTFTMSDGTISENTADYGNGGGVHIAANGSYGGTFTMSGGTIGGDTGDGNSAANGGGVFVGFPGEFTMTGGTINGNMADNGGGVCASCEFSLTNGTINGNTATSYGGGVYVTILGTFTMNSGTISQNTADTGGGVYVDQAPAAFSKAGGIIYGEDGDTDKNTAADDDSGYAVYVNSNPVKIMNITVGPEILLDSGTTDNWE